MDKLLEKLSPKERSILADLYEHDARHVLEKVLELRQLQIAQTILSTDADHDFTLKSRGQVFEDAWFLKILHENFKRIQKGRNESTSD